MIWLPGAYHAARDFLEAGFPEAVLLRHLPVDLSFVDLELRYLGDDAAQQQLRTEVVLPARKLGVSVWLAGVSLGGFVALDYAARFSGELAGVCLLAPYLGNRMLTAEIAAAAPGLDAWAPGELAEADAERRIWRYVKTRVADSPPLYLGFGHDDRFAAAHKLLAAALPPASVDVIAGGHEWRTWVRLWENFLESRVT
jgi:pimeloyl-ACP methyl ester carboxylesterase